MASDSLSWNVTSCTTPPEFQFQVTVPFSGTLMLVGLKTRPPAGVPTVTVEVPSPPSVGLLGLSSPEQAMAATAAAARIRRRCLMGSPVEECRLVSERTPLLDLLLCRPGNSRLGSGVAQVAHAKLPDASPELDRRLVSG